MGGGRFLSLAVSGMAMAAAVGPLTDMAAVEILAAFGAVILGVVLRRTVGRTDDRATAGSPKRQQSMSTSPGPVLMTGANSGTTTNS